MKFKIKFNKPEDYAGVPYQMLDYYKYLSRKLEEYMGINPTARGSKTEIPDILPASGHDICNYLARYRMASYQIQSVLKLDGRLDYDKLARAVRLSVDQEPVMGCRFVESAIPYWKRLDCIDNIAFCSFEETGNLDESIQQFLESPLDMDKDPMVKVKLIRCGAEDALCIKINHTCSDGAGAKEYIGLLSGIYSAIDRKNGTYVPKPNISGRKDQDKLFKELGIKNPVAGWNPFLDAPRTAWVFPWKPGGTNERRFVVSKLPQGHVELLSKYAKERGATINDLILTAYYRALFETSQPMYGIPMDISCTIDLRRYLPGQKAEAIRNFSGGFDTRIARVIGESFEGTLSRVMHATNKVKKGNPGLQNAIGAEYVEKTSFPHILAQCKSSAKVSEITSLFSIPGGGMCLPGLSNLGFVSKSLIKFGEQSVTDAYILPPTVRAPGFLLLACTYNDIMALTTSYYKGEIRRRDVKRFINKIKDELINGCV